MYVILSSFIWIYVLPIMLISPILSISLNSWFSIWMTLELNLMTFIPLIIYLNKFYKESSMKYFIIQSLSSSMMIFSSNMNFIMITNSNSSFMMYMNLILNISIIIKLGGPPFHQWFINLMNNFNWITCFLLSTYQKISPLILLSYIYIESFIYFIIISSSITSALMGNNHQSLRLILAYSSINHMSWLLLSLMINQNLWMLYFTNYFFINMTIMMILNKFNIYYINEFMNLNMFKLNKLILLLNLLSLSGMPPMLGFMMKWYAIFMINKNKMFLMILILTMMSMLTFLFYSRIMLSLMMNFNLEMKCKLINKFHSKKFLNLLNSLIMLTFLNLWIFNTWLF